MIDDIVKVIRSHRAVSSTTDMGSTQISDWLPDSYYDDDGKIVFKKDVTLTTKTALVLIGGIYCVYWKPDKGSSASNLAYNVNQIITVNGEEVSNTTQTYKSTSSATPLAVSTLVALNPLDTISVSITPELLTTYGFFTSGSRRNGIYLLSDITDVSSIKYTQFIS